jgi:hypothetical protein
MVVLVSERGTFRAVQFDRAGAAKIASDRGLHRDRQKALRWPVPVISGNADSRTFAHSGGLRGNEFYPARIAQRREVIRAEATEV